VAVNHQAKVGDERGKIYTLKKMLLLMNFSKSVEKWFRKKP